MSVRTTEKRAIETNSVPPCRHIRVNLGDPQLVKHVLDEQAAMWLLDRGFREDVSLSNLKLMLGFFAVAFTAFSHFYGTAHPENRLFLKVCVPLYFVLTAILQLAGYLVPQDSILILKKQQQQGKVIPSIFVKSTLKRYSTEYTLSLVLGQASASRSLALPFTHSNSHPTADAPNVTNVLDISEFFDDQGTLYLDSYQQKLSQIWLAFQKKTQLPLNAVEEDNFTSSNQRAGSKKCK